MKKNEIKRESTSTTSCFLNPGPAEVIYPAFEKSKIQISWLLKKPTDLDLHSLIFSI